MTEFLTDYNSRINNINNHNREIYIIVWFFMITIFLNLSILISIGYLVLPDLRLVIPATGLYYILVYKIVNDATLGYFLYGTMQYRPWLGAQKETLALPYPGKASLHRSPGQIMVSTRALLPIRANQKNTLEDLQTLLKPSHTHVHI